MRRRHIEAQHLDEAGQAGRLAFGQLEHEPGQSRGVDDRVLKRAFQAATHEPRVKRVVAVLDQDSTLGKAQEGAAGIAKLRRADEHRPVDVMSPVRVGIDRSLAINKRVKEGKWTVEPKAFRADLEDEEWRVAGGLDVQRDKLRIVEPGCGFDLRRVDGNLLPGHRLNRTTRLEKNRLRAHRACASARRAQSISPVVSPRRTRTAPA
jgi:hypothetical protein